MTNLIDWTTLPSRVASDGEFRALAVGADVAFALADPHGTRALIRTSASSPEEAAFAVVLPEENWDQLLAREPSPGTQHVLAHLDPRGPGEVLGDRLKFAQHLHLVRRAIELAAGRPDTNSTPLDLSGVTGRYVRVHVEPWGTCDVYVESSGAGDDAIVFLHTAGSDSTQYHGLLSLAESFPGHRLFAFDMPWHGRSGPAHGKGPLDYVLTSEIYADCVAAVIAGLDLPAKPVLVGASMAGAAVVEVAARHPESISAAVGCQAGPRVGNRLNVWLRAPDVNQALFVPEWTFGLMSPHSPKLDRDRVWWGYSQGGFAVYERDITYYTTCWDISNVEPMFGPHTPPIVLMSGSYDYTVPSSATQELAARIPGSIYHQMPELGHFPHAENPSVFAKHLAWALTIL